MLDKEIVKIILYGNNDEFVYVFTEPKKEAKNQSPNI